MILAVAIVARYGIHQAGAWRRVYVICAAVALYPNVFVGVTQAFLKFPALTALAPNQTEAPLVVAQVVVLALLVTLTIMATKKTRA